MSLPSIEQNYQRVSQSIAEAASAAGREPDAVRLVVVTKGHPLPAVQQVIAAGGRCLGENYVEEAVQKISASSGMEIEWHMIGHVQSRKAQSVVEHFAGCDSLDNLKLAQRLDRFAAEYGRILPVLLECNLSGEAAKFGFPAWEEARWAELVNEIAPIFELKNLRVDGLMTMPPYFTDAECARPYFQRLRRLQAFIQQRLPQVKIPQLSMGMSGDYLVAIQEGATMVRIGTAIMGERK